jgi:Ser/Thr protein kinase RdoA (MazF antagonist)
VAQDWTEESRHFTMVERVPGVPLEKIWSSMPQSAREELAHCTAEYLGQLRSLQSETMGSVDGSPLYCGFLFPRKGNKACQVPHGPLKTAEELWGELEKSLDMDGLDVPQAVRVQLRDRMPNPAPWTFTHGDLTSCNIMVDPTTYELTGIIDWEWSGYFPVWWEFAFAVVGLGQEDKEWKDLLRGNLANYEEALDWWLDFKAFTDCGWAPGRKKRLLEECGIDPM